MGRRKLAANPVIPQGWTLEEKVEPVIPEGWTLETPAPEERRFQNWYAEQSAKLGLDPNPDDPRHFYDYRAAFKAGAQPDETGHFPSEFKLEGHPRLILEGIDTRTGEKVEPSFISEFGKGALGTMETAAAFITQLYGVPAAGLAGLAALPFGGERAEEAIEAVSKAAIYQPETEAGQKVAELAFLPFTKLMEAGESLGDWTLEKTGSPKLASLMETAVVAAPIAVGGLAGRLGRLKPKRAFKTPEKLGPESTFVKEQFDRKFMADEGIQPFEEVRFKGEQKVLGELEQLPEKAARVEPTGVLTPEETFILDSQGLEGLKKSSQDRAVIETIPPETKAADPSLPWEKPSELYGGIPLQQFLETYTQKIGAPIWDELIVKKIPKALEKIPGGKAINRAILYDYRGDLPDTPLYMKSLEDMRRHQSIGREYAVDLGRRLQNRNERAQLAIGEQLRGEKASLTTEEAAIATEARNVLDALGKQAVDVGLLDDKVFFKNVGQYLPRLYTSKEYNSKLISFNLKKPQRLDLTRFMKRKDIPKEVRQQMGEILTPGYPVAKGIRQLTHDIELAKHFNNIAGNSDWSLPKTTEVGIPDAWKQMPSTRKLGKLSESYVHPEIFEDLKLAIRIMSLGERTWRKGLGMWKFGKVILSPKTHVRNLFSNSLLSHLGGMPLWKQPQLLTKAAREMKAKGPHWKAAKGEGLMEATFTQGELGQLFDKVEFQMKDIKAESLPEKFGMIGQGWSKAKIAGDKAAKLYQAEEQWFKMAKYIDNVENKKMSVQLAAKDAEKWLFNYAKLTKAQEAYRSKWYGAPFATFTIKAIPRIAEAAIKTPWRFAAPAAMIYGLEEAARKKFGDSEAMAKAKRLLRPEWMQGGFPGLPNFPRVPVEDTSGREYYGNLSYITPWGDLAESGGAGPIPGGIMPLSQPFSKELWQQIAGTKDLLGAGGFDLFWQEPIVREEDVAGLPASEKAKVVAKKRGRHLYNTMVPTLAMDIEKGVSAFRGKPDYRGRERPPGVVAADVFLGIKMYPVDYADEMMRQVAKLNPRKSDVAQKIRQQIRTLAVKRNFYAQRGQDDKALQLDKQIADKVRQLQGLGKELQEKGAVYERLQGAIPQIPPGWTLEKQQ